MNSRSFILTRVDIPFSFHKDFDFFSIVVTVCGKSIQGGKRLSRQENVVPCLLSEQDFVPVGLMTRFSDRVLEDVFFFFRLNGCHGSFFEEDGLEEKKRYKIRKRKVLAEGNFYPIEIQKRMIKKKKEKFQSGKEYTFHLDSKKGIALRFVLSSFLEEEKWMSQEIEKGIQRTCSEEEERSSRYFDNIICCDSLSTKLMSQKKRISPYNFVKFSYFWRKKEKEEKVIDRQLDIVQNVMLEKVIQWMNANEDTIEQVIQITNDITSREDWFRHEKVVFYKKRTTTTKTKNHYESKEEIITTNHGEEDDELITPSDEKIMNVPQFQIINDSNYDEMKTNSLQRDIENYL